MDSNAYDQAINSLKEHLADLDTLQITESKNKVFGRFQKSFSATNVSEIREEEFRAFLRLKNNDHWSGLHRLGSMMCADMPLLREALSVLLDESQPIEDRVSHAIGQIKGMGTAVATAILLVAYPSKYGVWNKTSEGGLKAVELWPHFERGETVGERYAKVNQILNRVASDVGTDLWTLDILWWSVQDSEPDGDLPGVVPGDENLLEEIETSVVRFSLERHLHDFLRDNWQDTSLGQEWVIYSEPGDPEKGYEYPCGVGRIDLLARHKTRSDWLVVELKRGQTSDATVGQLLRYIGWVKTHLAEANEAVQGLIIAHNADDSLRYALSTLPNVTLQLYEVKFCLHPVSLPGAQT